MKAQNKIRNSIAVAMRARYGSVVSIMKDRRQPRGGAKNKVREMLKDW